MLGHRYRYVDVDMQHCESCDIWREAGGDFDRCPRCNKKMSIERAAPYDTSAYREQ